MKTSCAIGYTGNNRKDKSMRKVISLILCTLIIGVILSSCNNSTVTITIDGKYENQLADEYASDKTTDENGNTVYTFTKPQYIEYVEKLFEKVKSEFRSALSETATYSYLNEDGTELVVGVDKEVYDKEKCKEQAEEIGELALLYNVSTLEHTGRVTVKYENCFTGEEYFKSVTTTQA